MQTKTYAELQSAGYLIVQSNSSRDRKHRLYGPKLRFINASADLKKLVALANEDANWVASVQQAEG